MQDAWPTATPGEIPAGWSALLLSGGTTQSLPRRLEP